MNENTPPVELFIPAHPKDYNKLPYILHSVAEFVPEIKVAHICAPDNITVNGCTIEVHCHTDDEVFHFDRKRFKYRPNWVAQQFIKVFQDVTSTDFFLVMDADILFNRPRRLFDLGGKPFLFLGADSYQAAYFRFNRAMFGIGKVYSHSFLSECTLYSKAMVRDMLSYGGYTLDSFYEKAAKEINKRCRPADSEMYGSYMITYHPNFYNIKYLVHRLGGKYEGQQYTNEEIENWIAENRQYTTLDIVTMHTWGSNYD